MTYTVDWLSYQWGLFLSTISAFNKHQRLLLSGNCYPGYQGAAHPRQTFLGVCHMFLPHKRLLKREGKIVDQSQHTFDLGSALWTLRNSGQDFRKDQKGLTFRTNCSINSHTFVPREIINPYLLHSCLEQNSLVTYSNCITLYTELVCCLAGQHFDFNSADRFSDSQHLSSSWHLRTMRKKYNWSF